MKWKHLLPIKNELVSFIDRTIPLLLVSHYAARETYMCLQQHFITVAIKFDQGTLPKHGGNMFRLDFLFLLCQDKRKSSCACTTLLLSVAAPKNRNKRRSGGQKLTVKCCPVLKGRYSHFTPMILPT